VDCGGFKHALGWREGNSENSRVPTDLLNDLVERGIKVAKWLDQEYLSATGSLLEGLALRRRLGSTNVIESPNSGVRNRTRRVKNGRDPGMVVRWVAASLLDMEQRFKRVMGHQ